MLYEKVFYFAGAKPSSARTLPYFRIILIAQGNLNVTPHGNSTFSREFPCVIPKSWALDEVYLPLRPEYRIFASPIRPRLLCPIIYWSSIEQGPHGNYNFSQEFPCVTWDPESWGPKKNVKLFFTPEAWAWRSKGTTYRNRDGRRILKRDKIKLLVFHIVYFFWVVSGEERRWPW